MASEGIKVALIDENQARAAVLVAGLREAGISDVALIPDTANLLRRLVDLDPDVIVIDLASPSRDVLEQMCQVSRAVARPVAMFVDQSDTDMLRAALDAGVSAYVVGDLEGQRVKAIVDEAILRFDAFARMQRELDEARDALAARKVIEKAKGILMTTRGLDEEAAYTLMRKTAMNEKCKIVDIARSVITAAELLR